MHLLFAHDHIFEKDMKGRQFSEKFPIDVWDSYLSCFSKITVIARSRNVTQPKKSIASSRKVSIEALPSLSSPSGVLFHRGKARRLLNAHISEVDAVIVRLPSEIGLLAFSIAKKLNKPTLIEMVGCPWSSLWNYGTLLGKVYAPLGYLRTKRALASATHVVYVTKSYLQKRYPTRGRSVSISNVKIPEVAPSVLANRLDSTFPRGSKIKVGSIGNLLPYKGIGTLIEAAAILKLRFPELQLLFLGGGDSVSWKKQAAILNVADLCYFQGTLPSGAAVFDWLDALDIYVQPSLTEGTPRGILEAMSRGCPVVASDVGGIPDLLPRKCLISPHDSNALASLIERFIEDSTLRTESSKRNFEVAKMYQKDRLDLKRMEILSELANLANSNNAA